jgi:flagellar assembly protein FliH
MTTLIKHGLGQLNDAVRPLDWRRPTDGGPPVTATDTRILDLEEQVHDLAAKLTEARKRQTQAAEEAFTRGEKTARAAYRRDEEAALAVLRTGVDSALATLRDQAANTEAVALLVCQIALEKVFGDAPDYRELVTRAVRVQIAALRRGTVVQLRVSAADFPGDQALRELEARLAAGALDIRPDPALPAGACRIELRLGQIELSVADHWDRLQSELRRLTHTGEPP